jgi:hypothetical protein
MLHSGQTDSQKKFFSPSPGTEKTRNSKVKEVIYLPMHIHKR